MTQKISQFVLGLGIVMTLLCGSVLQSNAAEKADAAEKNDAAEKGGEWVPLVQGNALKDCFILVNGQEKNADPDHIFTVDDGVIHAFKDIPEGKQLPFAGVFTEKEYSNFHFRLEFKWGTKKFAPRQKEPRDTGILFHVVGPDKIWPQSIECQIQEHDVGDIYAVYSAVTTTIDPKTKDAMDVTNKMSSPVFMEAADGGVIVTQSAEGSAYGVGRVRRSEDLERDGWNTVEVIVHGDSAVYMVNGKVNNRCTKICRPDPNDPKKTIPLNKGKLLLQAEGAEILYRNIEIKELPAETK